MKHTANNAACAAALIAMASGCRADTGPVGGTPVRLLVRNASCASDACTTIRVLAFPENQPITPGGMWSIVRLTRNASCAQRTAARRSAGLIIFFPAPRIGEWRQPMVAWRQG